ncbi:MAG TPA: hypothetical protein VK658_16640 [Chryseolinea sp.]|nr:hypothetical protein [Chryseolinea sp.]
MSVELNKYESCLFEIKKRVEVVTDYVTGKKTTGYLITEVEFICLQFRKIIELIALSSLVANKSEYEKQHAKFNEHWNARLIFQDLERLNPNFYPRPSTQTVKTSKDGQKYFDLKEISTGFMKKEDALKIYEKCGGILHADNPYRGEKNIKDIRNQFPTWLKRLMILMNHHSIMPIDGTIIVGLMKGSETGRPHASHFGQLNEQETEAMMKKLS